MHNFLSPSSRLLIRASIWFLQAGIGELAQKKAKPAAAPQQAGSRVYASIFTSSRPKERETYACRSVGARFL